MTHPSGPSPTPRLKSNSRYLFSDDNDDGGEEEVEEEEKETCDTSDNDSGAIMEKSWYTRLKCWRAGRRGSGKVDSI